MDDFLISLEVEGMTSRIKRLSDLLLYSIRDVYKTMEVDIEPNWNLVFRLLQENKEMTITEMAEKIQFSHPAVVKIINKMKKNGYIESFSDDSDNRKQILKLSQKAKTKSKEIEKLWQVQNRVIENLLSDSPHFMNELTKIENKLDAIGYKKRVLKKLME